jgi:transposase
MGRSVKEGMRPLMPAENQELQRIVQATSERVDTVRRATALLSVAAGKSRTAAGQEAQLSRQAVTQVIKRFNQGGLAALSIAAGRGRKLTYTSQQQARIVAEVQRAPDRQADQTATWSLMTLRQSLRKEALPSIAKETIRQVLHAAGYSYQYTRTWCRTGYALRQRKSGTVTVYDPQTPEKRRLIELAYEQAEAAGIVQLNQDEAGPYQAIPHPGVSWQPAGHPAVQPHEYERGGTAKLLTLFRPATGRVYAKGVVSATNAVLHPWLKEQLSTILGEIEKQSPAESLPPEEERPRFAQWKTWLWPHESAEGLPPLRIILIWDNLAGHLTPEIVVWLLWHGVMPLNTPIGGSWLNMAESIQRILVCRALSGQHPKDAQQVIEWLEQMVAGWNQAPTAFVWNGKRRRRRERARLRGLAGSGAAIRFCHPMVSEPASSALGKRRSERTFTEGKSPTLLMRQHR